MLSNEITVLIEEVVDEFVGGTRMFTAFEVTKEVQSRLAAPGVLVVRHLHMKEAIHDQLSTKLTVNGGNYQRQLKDVNAPTPAWVYYPDGLDPSGYVPMDRSDPGNAATDPSQPATVATFINNDADPVDPAVVVTPLSANPKAWETNGRLNVPNHVMRAAGFAPGDAVYVYEDSDSGSPSMVLSKTKKNVDPLTEYQVNSDGRVRISNAMLTMCKIDSQQFDFDGDTGVIVITKG